MGGSLFSIISAPHPLLKTTSPFPLRGRGIKGDGSSIIAAIPGERTCVESRAPH